MVKTSVNIGNAVVKIGKAIVIFLLWLTEVKYLAIFTSVKQLFTSVKFGLAEVNIGTKSLRKNVKGILDIKGRESLKSNLS